MRLDCNQYREDMDLTSQGAEDVYATFNVLMRRKPKENNFKAVLETIRELMNTSCVVPNWLHDIVLGYGDPGAAHYTNMPNNITTLNFNDTFLDFQHLRESFPTYEVRVPEKVDASTLRPPFKVTFEDIKEKKRRMEQGDTAAASGGTKRDAVGADAAAPPPRVLTVEPFTVSNTSTPWGFAVAIPRAKVMAATFELNKSNALHSAQTNTAIANEAKRTLKFANGDSVEGSVGLALELPEMQPVGRFILIGQHFLTAQFY